MYNPHLFAERYMLALETALKENPEGGLCGFELEWNLLDAGLHPLLTVGSGPSQRSFVDYLHSETLSPWAREYSQLEVFHWMIEWTTRPYYTPRGAVYEGRLMEAVLLNALNKAGRDFGQQLYTWHGNLLFPTNVSHDSIPGSWHIAKRRYLERCVDLYGDTLATAGTHTNLSLPEPLLAWDFMHLSDSERGDSHLDDYKSEFYITATRLMRAFAALFIATSASTPLQAQVCNDEPAVVLTGIDSVRNLTFPNPQDIDVPNLYRSYRDYLAISYKLVRRGVRFGNNNWTPIRARSFAEPVERLIAVTSEQLEDLYTRGLYSLGMAGTPEEMAKQIEMQNLLARIDIPMSRVEIRTDDGGHPLEIDIANLTLKHLLLLRFYADTEFGRAFHYNTDDITRARRNEASAARDGLRAEIENPLTGEPVAMRAFLRWTLNELRPLAEALDLWADLLPLREMMDGAPNTAERLRDRLRTELGKCEDVSIEILQALAQERQTQVAHEIETIAETYAVLNGDAVKFKELVGRARDDARADPQAPMRFRPRPEALVDIVYPNVTSDVLSLASELIRIPSVTASPEERLDEVRRAATLIFDYARARGLGVRYYHQYKYPALLVGFPGQMHAPVMLAGHFDVVDPEPDDGQFEPRLEGDYLWGRGSADMKTVVATCLVWMKDALRRGAPYPPINLLLVGNEENGEGEPMGTPHVLRLLEEEEGYQPELFIAGERTGETGDELWGKICTQNRGVMRFDVIAHGTRGHSGTAGASIDMSERLITVRADINEILERHLTLEEPEGWVSQARYPFIKVGTPGIYNITPDYGLLGVEVRPIPQDDLHALHTELIDYCVSNSLELEVPVMEGGIACDPLNPYLRALILAVETASGSQAVLGRKLPGTSARFAPRGQGVVWGQSGLGPHAHDERHFIPSIAPYYRTLSELTGKLVA